LPLAQVSHQVPLYAALQVQTGPPVAALQTPPPEHVCGMHGWTGTQASFCRTYPPKQSLQEVPVYPVSQEMQTALPEESSQVPWPPQVVAEHVEQLALLQLQTTTPDVSSQFQFGAQAVCEQTWRSTHIPGTVPASRVVNVTPASVSVPASSLDGAPPSRSGTNMYPGAQPAHFGPV
jgi:hypothetical protein